MSDKPKDLAARSAQQAKHSANNAGRAVEAAIEEGVDKITPKTSAKTQLVQGLVLAGVSWIAAGLSARMLMAANKTAIVEAATEQGVTVVDTRGRKVG